MTLIEVMVVITIIAIMGAVVFPSVSGGFNNLRLKTSAERLGNTFRYARERALRTHRVCQVTVDPERGSVEMYAPGRPPYRGHWELPPSVSFRAERVRSYVFTPDGAAPQIDVVLANDRGRTASVRFDLLTGLPQVEIADR